jgi:thiamine-monophosphate kinase
MPDEREIIEKIIHATGSLPARYSAIGDDVATTPSRGGKLVVKVDMLVESTDMPPGMSYRQAARKAVAACVSDFAAKGVRPDSFMVSLGLRRGASNRQVEQLAEGLRDAAVEWKIALLGGDTNEAKELVIDCAMLGFASRIVGRGGAKPGDLLVVTGRFGLQPAGLAILMRGAKAEASFRARAKDSALNPKANLDAGIGLGRYLTSAMDSSDGLARSLHTLATASGVGFEVTELPMARGVRRFALANGLNPEKLVLAGGEEYVVVGTINPRKRGAASRAVRRAGGELLVIGQTTKQSGRVVRKSRGAAVPIADEGWTHLG